MVVTILGIQHKAGEYNGRPYDNIVFNLAEEITENGSGLSVIDPKRTKVKFHRIADCVPVASEKELFELVGQKVRVFFNQYQQIDFIQLLN